MEAFFSGTDDKYELGDPGIHIVVGSINTKDMKYTIAASVVGSGRRFMVEYGKLIDATPIPGQEFHPKVIDYVDYSTPVSTYSVKGGFTNYPSTWVKKETKEKVKTDYNDLKNWGWDNNDDYSDPFYWSNTYNSSSTVQPWNIVDSLKDFVVEHNHNPTALKDMRYELYDFLSDLEVLLEPEFQEM